ncbi:hypothetical protein B0H17DRAFT_157100 [Mycena rosella]|uniref:Uncharacterized protein n=1 Tax=Mycena rosella TaxID=1033263 RepID=A0AAD7GBS0_MYCRO|nr:hypothetical protein B0H17DRAFT_157100 [Mycena rosella]
MTSTVLRSPASATASATALVNEPDTEVVTRILAQINVVRNEPATCTKYFQFKLPKPPTLETIAKKIDGPKFRSMLRVSIDSEHLRIKMHMPGSTHGRAAGLGHFILDAGKALDNTFMRHLFASTNGGRSPHFDFTTSTMILPEQRHGNYRKQPGWSAYPVARPSKMPSIVIEVGVSENMNDLRDDARQWLNNFGPQVLTVVLMKIHPETQTPSSDVTVEIWNRNPTTSAPRRARGPWTYYQTPNIPPNIPPAANLILHATDLFLPIDMPPFMAGQQIDIQGADIQFWVDQVLGD